MISVPLTCEQVDDLGPAFVLDAVTTDEAAAVRLHLATCTRGHPELAELGGAAAALALAAEPVEPSPALRARILAQVEADASPVPSIAPIRTAAGSPSRFGRWRLAAMAIAAVLIVALVGTSGLLARRLFDAQAYAQAASLATSIAAEQGSRSMALAPSTAGGPTGTAVVAADGRGVVLLDAVPQLSGSQVLEVWVIAGSSGTPQPAGAATITADGKGWLQLSGAQIASPLTVAVTREPGPGATTPTLPILTAGSTG